MLVPGTVFAADQLGENEYLTVSPLVQFIAVHPGETATVEVTYKNQTSLDASVEAELLDIERRSGQSESVELGPVGTGFRSAGGWITLDGPSFEVPHGEEHPVRLRIEVPKDAGPGGYYAGLALTARPTQPGAQFRLDARVDVPVLLTVDGDYERDVQVRVTPDERVRWRGGRQSWRVELRNEGDVHENVSGTLRVDGVFGAARTVPIDAGILLPDERRVQTLSLDLRDAPDAYSATATVELDDHAPAKATADRVYVVPWWSILLVVVAIALVWWRVRSRR